MDQIESYKHVLDIIANMPIDNSLLLQIAKDNPSAVVNAHKALHGKGEPAYYKEVIEYLHDGHKISAIKMVHEQTGMGLKEAKEEVERIDEER